MDSRNRLWWVMGGVGLLLVVVLTGGLYWLSPVDTTARTDLALPRPRDGTASFEYVAGQSVSVQGVHGAAAGTLEGERRGTVTSPGVDGGAAEAAGNPTGSGLRHRDVAPDDTAAAPMRQPIPRVTVDIQVPASPAATPAERAIPTSGARTAAAPATSHNSPATTGSSSRPAAVRAAPLAKLAPLAPLREFWVQVGSFASRSRANALGQRLGDQGIVSRVTTRTSRAEVFFRVRVGPYASRVEAEKFLAWVQQVDGLDGSYISEVRNAGG